MTVISGPHDGRLEGSEAVVYKICMAQLFQVISRKVSDSQSQQKVSSRISDPHCLLQPMLLSPFVSG